MVIAVFLPDSEPSMEEPVEVTMETVTIWLEAATSATRIAAIEHALVQTA